MHKNAIKNARYNCALCEYKTGNKTDYGRHCATPKHLINTEKTQISQKTHNCVGCNKIYKHKSGLCAHKKKCNIILLNNESDIICEDKTADIKLLYTSNMIMEILKQNQDFKDMIMEQNKQLLEQNKQMIEMASKTSINSVTNNTTNNNQQFNLHIFLNEKCKNAMNITDFVDTIKVQLADLEVFGTHGYCEGITRVFVRCLNEMDICKRPIHCSDLKREIMYVKDKDVWEKDDDRKLIKKAIDKIERKNHLIIPAWQVANPEFNQYDSKVNDVYNKLLIEAMGGETKEETEKNYNKITRSIAKGTIITKNPL